MFFCLLYFVCYVKGVNGKIIGEGDWNEDKGMVCLVLFYLILSYRVIEIGYEIIGF